jgi:isopenicillin N synthase-like dioxygenase
MDIRVPLVDLSPYYSAPRNSAAFAGLVGEIDVALRDTGFLCIKGHPVATGDVVDTQREALRFFDAPEAAKLSARAIRHKTRGWTPMGDHSLAYSMTGVGERPPPDLFERYRIGPFGFADDDYHRARADTAYAPNVWPAAMPSFETRMSQYYLSMSSLARDLLRLFALALDLDECWFDGRIDRQMSSLCLNHYPALTAEPLSRQLRAGAHTDYGTLTIVAPTAAPGGLQVRARDGRWHDVAVEPETFVVNIGDMMAQWTNDRWVSTLHRVANPPPDAGGSARRLSLVFFHQPNPDALVECIPGCADAAHPSLYLPVTAGDYISRKINLHFQSYRAA